VYKISAAEFIKKMLKQNEVTEQILLQNWDQKRQILAEK
jgi:hypothetical protein